MRAGGFQWGDTNLATLSRRILVSLAAILSGSAALAGIVNGDFDTPPLGGQAGDPWMVIAGPGGGPHGPTVDNPSPAGLGVNNYLLMGDRADLKGGANPSIAFQDFNPGNLPGAWHGVTFNAEFNPGN